MNRLRFNLNGTWVEETGVSPTTTLLRYLRDQRGLSGTKEGCAEGDCGACSVAVVERDANGKPQWRAINSCLVMLPMLQGKHVVTVEALKNSDGYHPVQLAMSKALGSQCGYCTPGIVMTMFEAAYREDLDAPWKLDDQLCGNLCRCTGYRPIREAAREVAGTCPSDRFREQLPNSLPESMSLSYEGNSQRFSTPVSFEELWNELDAHPDARFVNGGTDLSLEVTKKFQVLPKLISLEGIEELKRIDGDRVGSGVSIAELEEFSTKRFPSLHRMTRYFASRQIKHRGTVGGNICTASPIGDLPPALIALGAVAVLKSRAGERRIPLQDFFVSYRKTALNLKEILAAVELSPVPSSARVVSYKVSKRRELDISTVSASFFVDTDANGIVTVARLAYGGMAATPKRADAAEAALVGKPWTRENAEAAAKLIAKDFTPMSDHRGSSAYRSLVAANLLRGFFDETEQVRQPGLKPMHAASVQTAQEVARG